MRPAGLLRASAERRFIGGALGYVRSALLSIVFPAGCRICEQLLTEATRIPVCNDCLALVSGYYQHGVRQMRQAYRRS
jgi:hypothetical protein